MEKERAIDELVAMLDQSVASGVGHLNILVDEASEHTVEVEKLGCLDCAKGNLACSVPTLHKGLDASE